MVHIRKPILKDTNSKIQIQSQFLSSITSVLGGGDSLTVPGGRIADEMRTEASVGVGGCGRQKYKYKYLDKHKYNDKDNIINIIMRLQMELLEVSIIAVIGDCRNNEYNNKVSNHKDNNNKTTKKTITKTNNKNKQQQRQHSLMQHECKYVALASSQISTIIVTRW